jgi:hypothetical protein
MKMPTRFFSVNAIGLRPSQWRDYLPSTGPICEQRCVDIAATCLTGCRSGNLSTDFSYCVAACDEVREHCRISCRHRSL